MKPLSALATLLALPAALMTLVTPGAEADIVFQQPAATTGATILSAYYNPDGSEWDEQVWDAFQLTAAANISEIRWRGGYGGALPGGGRNIVDFEISIYASIPAGIQPDIGLMFGGRLAHYLLSEQGVPGNAGETAAGSISGVAMYDYHFVLPHTFAAAANTRYWVSIVALQNGYPTWGFAPATGSNGSHFAKVPAVTGDFRFIYGTGDCAFSLVGTSAVCNAPVVTLNPTPVSVCFSGPTITLIAAATSATPMTYRWLLNGNAVYDGPNGGGTGGGAFISGATTPHADHRQPFVLRQRGHLLVPDL